MTSKTLEKRVLLKHNMHTSIVMIPSLTTVYGNNNNGHRRRQNFLSYYRSILLDRALTLDTFKAVSTDAI